MGDTSILVLYFSSKSKKEITISGCTVGERGEPSSLCGRGWRGSTYISTEQINIGGGDINQHNTFLGMGGNGGGAGN
eukprot:scaffold1161_cov100-Skeletonema_dohrnii-CCMP3373.AAC.1